MSSINLTRSVFMASFLIEMALYGANLVCFFLTECFLLRRQKAGSRSPLGTVSVALAVLMVLATGHIATSMIRAWQGFIDQEGALEEFANLTNQTARTNIAATAIWGCMMVIGDSLVIWRCWILWQKAIWIPCIFGVLQAAFITCGVYGLCMFAKIKDRNEIFTNSVVAWFTAFNLISVFSNILVSSLISIRLYTAGKRIARSVGDSHARKYWKLLWTYLESGSIYPTIMVIGLILFITRSPFSWLAMIIAPQIMALMPMLMVLVVLVDNRSLANTQSSNSAAESASHSWSRSRSRTVGTSSHQPALASNTSQREVSRPTRPPRSDSDLHVHISTEQYKSTDFRQHQPGTHVIDIPKTSTPHSSDL